MRPSGHVCKPINFMQLAYAIIDGVSGMRNVIVNTIAIRKYNKTHS